MSMKILFISLGCDKNLVDTEMMLGMLVQKGYSITDDENEADIVVFIVDGKAGLTTQDKLVSEILRKSNKKVIIRNRKIRSLKSLEWG